jgi:hypothetical protein
VCSIKKQPRIEDAEREKNEKNLDRQEKSGLTRQQIHRKSTSTQFVFMKVQLTSILLFTVASLAQGQTVTSGLIPKTPTFYVNTNYYNNAGGESPGVDIAANGNVIIGWEDDGSGVYDFESAWSLFNTNGVLLTPQTVITSYVYAATITNTFLSYFRSDGSATPAFTGFGPKIKANRFGNGIGHGSSTDALGGEVPELAALNADDGSPTASFSAVQILNNDGTPIRILTGGSDADYQTTGSARIGDWDYLANGNIVIVNDSRQNDDLVTKFGGAAPGNHGTYRVVTSAGAVVKGYSLLSSTNTSIYNIWHGVGVTANGFAVRFSYGSGAKVRLFDNSGNPTSSDIDLATLAGHPEAGAGGRGDGTGFHGNGKDAYVHVATAAGGVVWVTVLNADGTLRWSRSVADTNETFVANRVDGAIAPDGRVIAVWDSALPNAGGGTSRLIQARLFGANGQPLGGRFVVSEWENPANPATIYTSEVPRVAWRNDTIAIVWLSHNAPTVVNDPTSPGAAEVIAAALFKVYDIAPSSLITKVAETGGDNEPTDTITAKWTGQTFPVSVANEPILGAVIGSNYTVGSFGNGAPAFVDRTHVYTNASPTVLIPSYLAGREYIMSGNDNRDNPSLTMDVTVSQPVDVYLLIDNRNGDGSNANPPTFTGTNMQWVLDQSWAAVKSGINRTGNSNVPDEVGIDEGSDGTINNWYSIYTKSFPAGTFQLKQADNNGQNMYGAVVALQQRMTIGQVGANIVITFPAGFRLQRATSVNGPWTDVSGTSPVTEPISPGQRYYRSVSP